jgi:hypothetical protein
MPILHIIGIIVGGRRGRFVQEYDDAAYYRLPYIRLWGCLPPGMLAWHLNEGENIETSERVREIARLPIAYLGPREADAEAVLLAYETERLSAEIKGEADEAEAAGEQQAVTLQGVEQ